MKSRFPTAALTRTAMLLQDCEVPWLVGGSTGLALRGAKLERAPSDIDIYVDKDSVCAVHDQLRPYVIDLPEHSETERYKSTLSHYRISDSVVELVGHFRVQALQSNYTTEVNEVLYPSRDTVDWEGYHIPLVPLGHELLFNLLRERPDRVLLTGQLMSLEAHRHLPILRELLLRNTVTSEIAEEALRIALTGTRADALSVLTSEEELQ